MTKALFLDRDGVINVDREYVSKPDDFTFIDGIFELCRRAGRCHYRIVVITNQSGIARGYYDEATLGQLHEWMRVQFAGRGIEIAGIYHCPHHPEVGDHPYRQTCDCRKPAPGMLLAAAKDLKLDLGRSVIVGDKARDMQAGLAAGVGRRILFAPMGALDDPVAATEIATNLRAIRF